MQNMQPQLVCFKFLGLLLQECRSTLLRVKCNLPDSYEVLL
jgi:hypothetical protein